MGCNSEVSTFLQPNPSFRSPPASQFPLLTSLNSAALAPPLAPALVTSPRAPRAAPPVRGSHCSAGCTGCAGAGLVLTPLSKSLPSFKAGRGDQFLALSTLRFSGAGHHEQTEGATGDSQRGNHRHAHRLAPSRGRWLSFFLPPHCLPYFFSRPDSPVNEIGPSQHVVCRADFLSAPVAGG